MTEHHALEDGRSGNLPTRRDHYEVSEPRRDRVEDARDQEDDLPVISIGEILSILWARKLWLLGAAIIGLLLALAYSFSQTPLYRSTATIELNPPTVPILSNGSGSAEEMAVPATDWEFRETQVGILRSRKIGNGGPKLHELAPVITNRGDSRLLQHDL